MTRKNRKDNFQSGVAVVSIVLIIILIFAVGLFGLIRQQTIKPIPVIAKSETPVLDKYRAEIEKIIK